MMTQWRMTSTLFLSFLEEKVKKLDRHSNELAPFPLKKSQSSGNKIITVNLH